MTTLYRDVLPQFKKAIVGAMGDYPYAITQLMARSKLSWSWKLEPEQRLSVEIADELRLAASQGRLKGIFCHVANEGKRSRVVATILKAMGLISGAPDFWFIWNGGGGVIEIKRPDEALPKLKDNQAHFRTWAEHHKVRHAHHNSKEQVLLTLRQWGFLEGKQ